MAKGLKKPKKPKHITLRTGENYIRRLAEWKKKVAKKASDKTRLANLKKRIANMK